MVVCTLKDIVSLCKRRGFIYQSSEIYGGIQGIYDFGPLGVELKNNLKKSWWFSNVHERDDVLGLDSSILVNRKVMYHSMHEEIFTDPLIECKDCNYRMRADHIEENECVSCGSNNLSEQKNFNLMMATNLGPVISDANKVYLRPETAQSIFINFKNILNSNPKHLPFGIAQIGKAFRNEITPKNFIFRVREFEQMELEFFCRPNESQYWFDYWVEKRLEWWRAQGIKDQNLKLHTQSSDELAHYSNRAIDILFQYPHGFDELEGIADRGNFDLVAHSKKYKNSENTILNNNDSTANLMVRDQDQEIIPHVIEPSSGVERGILAILCSSYKMEKLDTGDTRKVLNLAPHLSPVKIAIIPLSKKNTDILELSNKIKSSLTMLKLGKIILENTGNIGKSYRKHDEIGTPLCLTVDFDSINSSKRMVTFRYRDTMKQISINLDNILQFVTDYFHHK